MISVTVRWCNKMIVMDYSPFANTEDGVFTALNETTQYEKIRFQNGIFDEVHMLESIDIVCSEEKTPWDYDTVFLWKGENLEAGNVELEGIPINSLLIKRRRKEDFVFEDIMLFPYDPDKEFYEFKDKFIESHEDYIYGVQPLGGSIQNPVLGEIATSEVEASFSSVWIVGKDVQYKLMYNLDLGAYETVMPSSTIETLGSMYPYVIQSGDIRYRKGNIKTMLLSDKTLQRGDTSPRDEKNIRRAIMAFLTDGKPKYFKDGSGEQMLISIVGAPKLVPNNDLEQMIYNIEVEFVEIGSTDTENLIAMGLLEGVEGNGN